MDCYFLSQQNAFTGDLKGLFGECRFTAEDQNANPTEPRTRIVKDVLRVGKWKVGRDAHGRSLFHDFTAEFIKGLVEQFTLAKSRGVAFNLCNTHDGREDADKQIAVIDDLKFDGETLWASFYVTPEQSLYLSNPARKVSVGVAKDWEDGQGNKYPFQLEHIAVVGNPVVSGQGRFLLLSNDAEGNMDFAELVAAINMVLAKSGMGKLPEDINEESLIMVLKTLGGGDEGSTEGQEGEEEAMQMSNEMKGLMTLVTDQNAKIDALTAKLATMETEAAKARFELSLDGLAANGNITAHIRDQYRVIGEKGGWNLSLLDGLDKMQLAPSAKVAKKLATGGSPKVEGVSDELKDEDIAKLAGLLK